MSKPERKRNRIKDYDYSQNGAYFVTICTQDRRNVFWKHSSCETSVGATFGRPHLSDNGCIVDAEIRGIQDIYENVTIDKYVIMPNHIHLIIVLHEIGRPQVAPTISRIIKQFKGAVTKKIGFALWQRSFYEHIIRNEQDYQGIWDYIDTNPLKWESDKYFGHA